MRNDFRLAAVLLVGPLAIGCEVAAGPVGYGPDEYAVGPGYYYDEEYVDVGGYHHPRDYWYHHDNHWDHVDGVPHAAAVHERGGLGFGHPAVAHGGFGAEHGGSGGEHGGGGGHGGR